MKRIIATLAFAFIAVLAFAQDIPAGIRVEAAEFEQDEMGQFSVFKYKDDDGTLGYYMSVAYKINVLGIFRDDITDMSIDHIDETCLCIGDSADEALSFMEDLLALLDEDPGTTVRFKCRKTNGAEGLTDYSTATCVVVKKAFGKQLRFIFESGKRTAETDLSKNGIKALTSGLKLNMKLHPGW